MGTRKAFSLIWGKVSSLVSGAWTPLYVHHADCANCVSYLWDYWLSDSCRKTISDSMGLDDVRTCQVLRFIAASHDLGKCTPAFQTKRIPDNPVFELSHRAILSEIGLPYRDDLSEPNALGHSVISQWILERNNIDRSLAIVAGGHHGKPPGNLLGKVEAYPSNFGLKDDIWESLQKEHYRYAVKISGIEENILVSLKANAAGQALMMGLVIMADWISSNELLFPAGNATDYSDCDLEERSSKAWSRLHLPEKWKCSEIPKVYNLFTDRFGFTPRPFQEAAVLAAATADSPGLFIVEAPMGEGKTEAALAMSEVLANRFNLSGLFFALPTQATADGLFAHVVRWIERASIGQDGLKSIFLAHGKSKFNKIYSNIPSLRTCTSDDRLIVHEWFYGRKKGMLSDFIVGTVDQVLMAALKRKHLALRHLGLANKVVIIDEVHAYDEYMGSYLDKSLSWLGAYNVPVILLSATLPRHRRETLVSAYRKGKSLAVDEGDWSRDGRYPLITSSTNSGVVCKTASLSNRGSSVKI